MITKSPAATLVTPSPVASTTPAASCPKQKREFVVDRPFPIVKVGVAYAAQACTLTSASPGPGSGTRMSSSVTAAPTDPAITPLA